MTEDPRQIAYTLGYRKGITEALKKVEEWLEAVPYYYLADDEPDRESWNEFKESLLKEQ